MVSRELPWSKPWSILVCPWDPRRYLISSSSQYYGHPDADAMELILKHHEGGPPELVFNYLSPKTEPWADDTRQRERGYTASFPSGASWGV